MAEERCPECGGLDGAHGAVHARHATGGGGRNRPCSRASLRQAVEMERRAPREPECPRCDGIGTVLWGGRMRQCPICGGDGRSYGDVGRAVALGREVGSIPVGEVPALPDGFADDGPARAARLEAFARSVVDLDDPDPESPGFQRRSTIRLQQIIDDARAALGEA